MPVTTTLPEHLTVRELAERLHVHPDTIRRQVKAGKLRALRVGSVVRIPVDAFDEPSQPTSSARPSRHALAADPDIGRALGADEKDAA